MKKYNKILEAVRRGIQLALDDYQNIENNSSISQTNDVINAEDVIQDKLNFYRTWVDLGLPSGTLWGISNIGADCGDYPESWYGDYFAWGELEPKEKYSWETYKHGSDPHQLTKYCTKEAFGASYVFPKTDGLTELQSKDDIATIIFGDNAHIPTEEQIIELIEHTTHTWETNYNNIGLSGTLFKGRNGNTMFIPAAGFYDADSIKVQFNNQYFYCWSSTLNKNQDSFAQIIVGNYLNPVELNYNGKCHFNDRCLGYTIRPVYNR